MSKELQKDLESAIKEIFEKHNISDHSRKVQRNTKQPYVIIECRYHKCINKVDVFNIEYVPETI